MKKENNIETGFEELEGYINKTLRESFEKANRTFDNTNKFEDKIFNLIDRSIDMIDKNIDFSGRAKVINHPESRNQFNSINGKKIKNDTNHFYSEPKIIEIHDFIIIRVDIPKGINESKTEVFLEGNRVIIMWQPNSEKQVVNLPYNIRREGIKAIVKNKILEIRIPTNSEIEKKKVNITYK